MRIPLAALFLSLTTLALPAPAGAVLVGDVAACAEGRPSLKVRVSGFKESRGQLKFSLYREGGWLKKGGSINKFRIPVTAGAMDVCIAVPAVGAYAVAVHHDVDGDKEKDRTDGAGFSRNPRLSLVGRPSFAASQVAVGDGVRPIAIQLMYLKGLSIGPARSS